MTISARSLSVVLASSMLVLLAAACGGGTAAAPTAAPSKPAASPVAAATSAPTAVPAPQAATAAPASSPPTQAASSGGDILIGMNAPMTGISSGMGDLSMKSANLAVKQINEAGGINGHQLKLIPEDNQSTNPGALASLSKSIEQDKVLVELGPVISTQIQAISDADKQAGVPMATGGTAVKNTQMGNPWLFRLRPDDSIAAAAMVQYIKDDMKLTKIGIMNDSDAAGAGGADLVAKYAQQQGLTVVKREPYTANTKDYTSLLLGLKTAGAQVMALYATRAEDAAIIQRQYKELGSPFRFIGSAVNAEADTLALSKDNSVGIDVVVDFTFGASDASKKYASAYTSAYNSSPDTLTAWNFDAINIMANAIKQAGTDRSAIMKAILANQNYQGVCGTFAFTPNGDGLHENSVVEVQKGGTFKLLKVVKVAPTQ